MNVVLTVIGTGYLNIKRGPKIMAGTKAGGQRAKKTNLERHGKDYFADIGSKGGRVRGVKKGFAADPERARLAGIKGGARSRRGKRKVPLVV